MKESKTWEERVDNFTAYHEYVLSQYVFAPIYEPVQNFAYNNARLSVPDTVHGTRLQSQTILDMAPL